MMQSLFSKLKQLNFIQQNDLLGLMICIAAILHTTIIFGVGFAHEDRHIGKVLDVTLASFQDDKAPDKADFLAQANQQGSGAADKALIPKTTSVSDFQDSQSNPAPTPPPESKAEEMTVIEQTVITTTAKKQEKVDKQTEQEKKEGHDQQEVESETLATKIASLEAQIAEKEQAYAKRPKILQITSSATKKDKGAAYQNQWREIIEKVGNLNYPKEASRRKIYGNLRLLVSIKRNGQLDKVVVLKSSGWPVLDKAAMRIVRLAAPFPPFPKELADTDIIEIIRTWRFSKGNSLSTED